MTTSGVSTAMYALSTPNGSPAANQPIVASSDAMMLRDAPLRPPNRGA